jgi:hypothetical protein
MSIPFDIYFMSVSLIASIVMYFRKNQLLYLKIFPLFLLLTIEVEAAGTIMSGKNINTSSLYNIFTTLEFVFYFWMLRQIIKNSIAQKIILYCLCLYPVLVLTAILFWIKPGYFHAPTYALGCLLVVAICIYYFFELFQLPHSVNLIREPAFWICSGLLFFYSCSFPIFGLANIINQLPGFIVRNIEVILNIMNGLLYSLFTIAFLCTLKMRRSIS